MSGHRRPGARRAAAAWLLVWIAAILSTRPAAADDPVVSAQVDRHEVAEGGVITLTITLEGFSRQAGDPEIPRLDGFEIYSRGSSTNITLVNGKLSSSTGLTYQLVARRAGTYTLPPIRITDRGRAYQTQPITLRVLAAGAQPPASQTPQSGRASGPAPRAERADGRGLFAELEVDKTEAFLDEQIVLRFRLYQRADVTVYELSDFTPPATEGFWREDLGQQPEQRVRSDGSIYILREVAWVLFPTKVGELEIGPGSVVAHVPDRSRRGIFATMFDRQPVQVASKGLRVRVKPLPSAGRPADFTGSVGQYEISAAFDPPQVRQGEATALTVTVRGAGHVQTIGAPVWPEWEGLRVFDSGEAVSVNKSETRVEGEKTFTQVLAPSRTGSLSLDPIRFSYFDPARERYVSLSTAPLALEVLPAAAGVTGTGGGASDVVTLGQDILYIRPDVAGSLRLTGSTAGGGGWLVHLVPLALAGGALWLRGRRAALARDPALARRAQALKRAEERLKAVDPAASAEQGAAGLAEALEGFLSDWLDAEARGMRRADLEGELRASGAPAALVTQALELLAWADEVRFGAGGRGGVGERVEAAQRMVREFDAAMRKGRTGVSS